MAKQGINKGGKNLHADSSYVEQPQDTARFSLNAINETRDGDRTFRTIEEANEPCYALPENYIPLGKVYISDSKQVVLSVAEDESMSEIGLVDKACNYTTIVNADLGFKITNQIDVTYRLRRGCEDVIYFTTPTPMYFNFNDIEEFQDGGGNWDPDKFKLFRRPNGIPIFQNIEIEENGNTLSGSYNAAIQYLDEDLNPTEWLATTDTINIYNDRFSRNFSEIRGSTNKNIDYLDFGTTNKSIKFTLSNLDTSFPFYRIAIIASNSGTGQITSVRFSAEIATEVTVFNYGGDSTLATEGTELEIQQFANIIDSANSIEQIENRLILSDTKSKQINYCKLQKYASRIKADFTTKEVILNQINPDNPKSGLAHIEGMGYMPGEIYSFGIVYQFADGDVSPTYHIPGRNWNPVTEEGYWSQMDYDNACENTFYTDNSSCDDYWGKDSEGINLLNRKVRHHRFPLRSDVNLPLITEEPGTETISLYQLKLTVTGTINAGYSDDTIEYVVEYEIDGNISFYEGSINVSTYDPANGFNITITTSSSSITVNDIYENGSPVTTPSATTDLTYATTTDLEPLVVDDKIYKANIFGIKFSNIDKPPIELTGGHEIVGYYIVRNERDEDNKTILDSGIMTPLLEEPYFVAHGHLMPNLADTTRIKDDAFALIHPSHKFSDKEYGQTTEILKEGEYRLYGDVSTSSVRTQDVMAGTSYDPDVARRRERDNDGFTLHTLTRDHQMRYVRQTGTLVSEDDLSDVFYLDSLQSRIITDTDSERKEIFNISGDNKIGIVQTKQKLDKAEFYQKAPYVLLKRNLADPYSNFRSLDYYNDMPNRALMITDTGNEVSVFGGDVTITPMRYHSSTFYDIRLRKRASKKGVFNIILGVLTTLAGILLSVITPVFTVSVGAMITGFGISQIASGIRKERIATVYSELYDAGLRNAVNDDDTDQWFGVNPPDDEIQWFGDTFTNIWFETTENMALRHGLTSGNTDFLNAPVEQATPGDATVSTIVIFGNTYGSANASETPQNELDSYMLEKLTTLDSDNENGRLYQGYAMAEYYSINPDYKRRDKQKVYTHLGIEYDCCSDCVETFPHRNHYSEQSFQEELSDNYRTFLPNNYRDIEGETGRIVNTFRIKNNFYIHTERALWHQPQNIQERVTGDVISFIGTGEFFSIPPRKITDDDQQSAGTQHKWGSTKTKAGVIFPSSDEGKIYLFTGDELKPISSYGYYSWFQKNIPSLIEQQYFTSNSRDYPYLDNPSNQYGEGFITTYDGVRERLLITKKDYSLTDYLEGLTDYEICVNSDGITLFENFSTILANYASAGFEYAGMENCRMKFIKTEYFETTEEREILTSLPNTADIHVFLDTSGSFGTPTSSCLANIRQAVEDWEANYAAFNPDWTGTVYFYEDASERWLNYAQIIASTTYSGQNLAEKDIVVISFINEAETVYHDDTLDTTISSPTSQFISDYNDFLVLHNQYNSFVGVHYPIVFGDGATNCGLGGGSLPASKNFLLHSVAALKGVPMTESETFNFSLPNPGFTSSEWQTLRTALQGANPYPDNALENYGWVGKWDRNAPSSGPIITSEQFQEDIEEILQGVQNIEIIEVTTLVPQLITQYVDGTSLGELTDADNSWTMSFSLKDEGWVSAHSYTPNFYLHASNRFYSWIHGNDNIYKHGVKGTYANFYGVSYPFIVEVVSNNNPVTNVWYGFTFQTEAKEYISASDSFLDKRDITFNKILVYNTEQCTGIVNMIVKDQNLDTDYLSNQVENDSDIIIDRTERDWRVDDLRDKRINYATETVFLEDLDSRQVDYFIDKVVNPAGIDTNKPWYSLESFKDKFLVIRFIFDTFDNVQLTMNYSIEPEKVSDH